MPRNKPRDPLLDLECDLALNCMCLDADIFHNLMGLYPETAAKFKDWAVIKREIFLHYCKKAIELNQEFELSGIPKSLTRSFED